VFVTNHGRADRFAGVDLQTVGDAGEPDQEANNDAGLGAHPSKSWTRNCVHFQLAMLAYKLELLVVTAQPCRVICLSWVGTTLRGDI